jgi:TRAP-type C4-dicarboxylate transport system substrate-binding protein
MEMVKSLGGAPTPIAFGELYTALQQKVVDGMECPIVLIHDMKFYEVQKYLSLTRHSYAPLMMLFSKKVWDGLSPAEQETLRVCAVEGRDEQRKTARQKSTATLDTLKSKGMMVNDIAPAEMQRIRDKTKVVWDRQAKAIGPEAMGLVLGELKRIRGQ